MLWKIIWKFGKPTFNGPRTALDACEYYAKPHYKPNLTYLYLKPWVTINQILNHILSYVHIKTKIFVPPTYTYLSYVQMYEMTNVACSPWNSVLYNNISKHTISLCHVCNKKLCNKTYGILLRGRAWYRRFVLSVSIMMATTLPTYFPHNKPVCRVFSTNTTFIINAKLWTTIETLPNKVSVFICYFFQQKFGVLLMWYALNIPI